MAANGATNICMFVERISVMNNSKKSISELEAAYLLIECIKLDIEERWDKIGFDIKEHFKKQSIVLRVINDRHLKNKFFIYALYNSFGEIGEKRIKDWVLNIMAVNDFYGMDFLTFETLFKTCYSLGELFLEELYSLNLEKNRFEVSIEEIKNDNYFNRSNEEFVQTIIMSFNGYFQNILSKYSICKSNLHQKNIYSIIYSIKKIFDNLMNRKNGRKRDHSKLTDFM